MICKVFFDQHRQSEVSCITGCITMQMRSCSVYVPFPVPGMSLSLGLGLSGTHDLTGLTHILADHSQCRILNRPGIAGVSNSCVGWSDDKQDNEHVFTGSSCPCGADGSGSRRRTQRSMGTCITLTVAASICRSNTPNAWPKQASNLRSAASATVMIEPVGATGSRPLARALAETINGLHKAEVIHRRGR